MRTKKIYVSYDGTGREEALRAAEDFADAKGLTAKGRIHIRLITEELLGMVQTIGGRFFAYYSIDDDESCYRIHLSAQVEMDHSKKEAFIGSSTTGKNSAAKGIINKLKDVYQTFMLNYKDILQEQNDLDFYGSGIYNSGTLETFGTGTVWSLQKYRSGVKADKENGQSLEEWDELERSIIANLADDISVGIVKNSVEMIVTKYC